MSFVQAAAGWFEAKTQGCACAGRHPQHRPPSGKRAPPYRYQAGFTRSLGWVRGRETLPAPHRTARFLADHPFQQVSHPRRGRVPREDLVTWGQGGGPAKVPCQMDMNRAVGSQAPGRVLPWGLRPGPSSLAKSLPWAPTAPPCPEAAI